MVLCIPLAIYTPPFSFVKILKNGRGFQEGIENLVKGQIIEDISKPALRCFLIIYCPIIIYIPTKFH